MIDCVVPAAAADRHDSPAPPPRTAGSAATRSSSSAAHAGIAIGRNARASEVESAISRCRPREPGSAVTRLRSVRDEQQRADHQHQRQRHLPDDERAPQAERSRRVRRPAAAGFHGGAGRGARRADRRQQAEQQRTPATASTAMNANTRQSPARSTNSWCRCVAIERDEHAADSHCASQIPSAGAGDGEQQALDEQLAEDPDARRADRQPHGDLALARGRARQHQVGEVRAGNQQHQRRSIASSSQSGCS